MMRWNWLAASLLCIAGCAAITSSLPPVPEAGETPAGSGRIVWHDLVTHEPDRLASFYGELLGWTFDDAGLGTDYRVILNRGRPIGGLAGIPRPADQPAGAQWLGMISVADVDSAVGAVRAGGGQVPLAPTNAGRRGRTAVIAGPNGARIGLISIPDGDPPPVDEPEVGSWLWDELWSPDPDQVEAFYRNLAGLSAAVERVEGDLDYRVLFAQGEPRAGVVQTPSPDLPANWVSYVRVDDVADIARRAESLGGQVLLAPRATVRFGSVAIIRDPVGGVIGIQSQGAG